MNKFKIFISQAMLIWSDLISNQKQDHNQEFFMTSSKLQNKYKQLCEESSYYSNQLYRAINENNEKNIIHYTNQLEKYQSDLDLFVKKYDIKF